jgi:glycerol-3-phosphate acyltransferase PlsY
VPIVGYLVTALVAYLLGSIPTGFLVAKAKRVDIRTVGSGNIGATNVFRYFGVPAGLCVLIVDALKGWLAVAVAANLLCDVFFPTAGPLSRDWFRIVAGLCAVLGHNYTCWLYFKGGKGIATSAGVLLALVPYGLLIIFVVWVVVFLLSRYVSLASVAASAALPIAVWITGGSFTLIVVTAAMTALAIYKHKANIKRLLNGTENRIGPKKPAPGPEPSKPSL